jgi:ABC-type multidrug transport system permease subunit
MVQTLHTTNTKSELYKVMLIVPQLPTGVMWPFEGMPTWLQYISGILPATYPAQAMRAIMGRGTYNYTMQNLEPATSYPSIIICFESFGQ